MAIVFAVVGGINHVYMLVMIFALMFCVQVFGHISERVCPPKDLGNDTRPRFWLVNDTNPHLLWAPYLNGKSHRLFWHLMGYFPYLTVWSILLQSFFSNASNAPAGGGPPTFVYFIIFGQFLIFSMFGITQFVLLFLENGPSRFVWGEISYLFLSLLAKSFLGLLLIANVLMFESLEESMN